MSSGVRGMMVAPLWFSAFLAVAVQNRSISTMAARVRGYGGERNGARGYPSDCTSLWDASFRHS